MAWPAVVVEEVVAARAGVWVKFLYLFSPEIHLHLKSIQEEEREGGRLQYNPRNHDGVAGGLIGAPAR